MILNEKDLTLPEEVTPAEITAPRDLVIVSIPKMGKGTILGHFTTKYNAIVLDLEKGGYEYIPARKLTTYTSHDTTLWESYQNYIAYRNLLFSNKKKYDYLIIDNLSDLDILSEIGGTLMYMDTVQGKKFNRDDYGKKLEFGDPKWKSVIEVGEGYGYRHSRNWFLQQIEIFKQISPFRIYAAHVSDKYIKDMGKEEVVGTEISLTGRLKSIFASKVTALAKLVAEDNKRYLNFDVINDSIVAGSRAPNLRGKILISEMDDDNNLTTYWENIYK